VNAYKPGRKGPQSVSAFELRDVRRTEASPTPPPPPVDEFDPVKAARRILDDIGSAVWDLHDRRGEQ
jgi:hypothetical protein